MVMAVVSPSRRIFMTQKGSHCRIVSCPFSSRLAAGFLSLSILVLFLGLGVGLFSVDGFVLRVSSLVFVFDGVVAGVGMGGARGTGVGVTSLDVEVEGSALGSD